tara:strand:+ start:895 stop:1308 length:414 start_codon:yes stop_codon:yes gene_type:complete
LNLKLELIIKIGLIKEMSINYGDGLVFTDIRGSINIIIKFDGKILISKINKNINLEIIKNLIYISGNLNKQVDNLLFEYFGTFKPVIVKNLKTRKKESLNSTSLSFWNRSSNFTWDSDSQKWNNKDSNFTHIRKLKR